jgi:hypothetical protein
MTNPKSLQRRVAKLQARRAFAPHIPPLVISALDANGQSHLICVLWRHLDGHESWQHGCRIDPPSQLIALLRHYGCSLDRDMSSGEMLFRPSLDASMLLPVITLSQAQGKVFLDSNRFRVEVAGRRFGKTFQSILELLRMAWPRNKEVWYVGPVYRQVKDTIWPDLKRMAKPYLRNRPNESDLSLELAWGSRIALRSATNYDSLRGAGLDGLVLDEFADIAPEAWQEVLRPMLSDRRGAALFIGTPKGRNHFYDLAQKAKTELGWANYSYTTIDGGRVAIEEIQAAQNDLDPKTFRQEYEASFENYGGLVYYAFEREKNVASQGYNPLLKLCWSLDFNINPMSSVIAQIDDRGTPTDSLLGYRSVRLNVLDEIVLPHSNTAEACRVFMNRLYELTGGRAVDVAVYGDPAGNAQNTAAAGKSDWNIVEELLSKCPNIRSSYHYASAHSAIRDRVNSTNAVICTHMGERRLYVDPKCRQLIKDLEQVTWKEDANGNTLAEIDKKDPERTHVSDALGYLIETEFGIGGFAGFHIEPLF